MPQTLWPITWPIDITEEDPAHVEAAELFASQSMHALTARRIGYVPVTVMPCTGKCSHPRDENPFHPVLTDMGRMANCFCSSGCSCETGPRVYLDSPVGAIINVTVDGVAVPPAEYHLEGNWLVRTGGKGWPSCSGERFTVTYSNGYNVDALGKIAAGHLAVEYLNLQKGSKKCRLPDSIQSISRAGVSMQFESGMFPGGVTGMAEVDTYLMLHNPYALKVTPTIHSVDRHRNRQVTWRGLR